MRRIKPERRRVLASSNQYGAQMMLGKFQSVARLCRLQMVGRWFTATDEERIPLGRVTVLGRPLMSRMRVDLASQRRVRLLSTRHGQILAAAAR